ncbi:MULTISPECIES: hypothetical protein [unclassified Streptomyces]|uniref:hypothetical protein n=1 Tax=unclassified Streptomyces TaxID=2593676 RepID=UPI0033EA79C6
MSDHEQEHERQRTELLGTEMREATLPDGTRAVIVVKAGTPQAEVDEQASRMRRSAPEAK